MSTNVWRVWAYNPEGHVVPIGTAACQDFDEIQYAQRYAHELTESHPGWTTDIVQFNIPGSAR
jgi:hypothetical protein